MAPRSWLCADPARDPRVQRGFDQFGELRWHGSSEGSSDVVRMVVLFGCGVAGTTVRSLQLRRRRQETGRQLDRELRELTRAARRTQGDPHA